MSIKAYLMAILDNYMFRRLLAIFRLSYRELNLSYYIQGVPVGMCLTSGGCSLC